MTFSVKVINPTSVNYQWQFENVDIPGATNSSFSLTNIQIGDLGHYTVILRNAAGAETRGSAILHLKPTLPAGTVISWQNSGQPEPVASILATNAISIGGHSIMFILHDDGTVSESRFSNQHNIIIQAAAVKVPGLTNIIEMASSFGDFLAVTDEGTLVNSGVFDPAMRYLRGVKKVATVNAFDTHYLALLEDGNLVAWGSNNYGQCDVPENATNIIDIWAGDHINFALRQDGKFFQWGSPQRYVPPATLSNMVSVSISSTQIIALKSDGTVESFGQAPPSIVSNAVAVAAGDSVGLALTIDSRVAAWNWDAPTANVPSQLTGVTAIAANYDIAFAITTNAFIGFSKIPTDQTVLVGGNAMFTATMVGTAPLTYQWKFNNANIPGATQANLAITNARLSDAGIYTLAASMAGLETMEYPVNLVVNPISLQLQRSQTNFSLSWPASANGFTLQQTTNFNPPIYWSDVVTNVVVQGGTNRVSLPLDSERNFFRLKKP